MTPCGCEADANGTMTQLILQELSGEPAFGADMVEFNRADDSAVLWHCGQAPLTMADTSVQGGIHSNRKLPLVMEFALKAGRVTLARLNRLPNGALRLAIGRGEILRAPKSFSGTSGVVRFDKPAMDVLDTILREGLEHHVAMAYGDHMASLVVLARMLKLPVLMLT
jgi:L-fucose isomerase-like protein